MATELWWLTREEREEFYEHERHNGTWSAIIREYSNSLKKRNPYGYKFLGRAIKCLIWTTLVLTGVLIAGFLVLTIIFMNSRRVGFEPDSPEFPLYKNTRFKECAASSPAQTNCTLLEGHLLHKLGWYGPVTEHGQNYLAVFSYQADQSAPKYSWCSLASCLSDFKVIPSTPLDRAFSYSGLVPLLSLLTMGISIVWALKDRIKYESHDPEHCKGFGFGTWSIMALDLGCFIFWWSSFFTAAFNPYRTGPVSILAWVTVFRYALSVRDHPLKCWLVKNPRWEHRIVWTLLLTTAAQLVVTYYMEYVRWEILWSRDKLNPHPSYDCLASQIPDAPGFSPCSPEQLCAKNWLFDDKRFDHIEGYDFLLGLHQTYITMIFIFLNAILLGAFLYLGYRAWRESKGIAWISVKGPLIDASRYAIWILLGMIISNVGIGIWGFFFTASIWRDLNGETAIAYDMECRAVHVPVSPYRHYLDVNGFDKALRIAKMWFNA